MKNFYFAATFLLGCTSVATAAETLPVREVTIFKDGHAFVMREGDVAANRDGEIVINDVPEPVVGTFWAYALKGKLRGVTAGRNLSTQKMDALNLRDLIKANIGAAVTIIDGNDKRFDATILSVPQTPPLDNIDQTETPEARYQRLQNQSGNEIVLLQTKEGVLVRSLNSIGQLIFKNAPRAALEIPQFQSSLRLQLEDKPAPGQKVGVGFVYLQKGLRWIPNYRLSLGKDKTARLQLQATLANDLIDLDDAAVNLVIGVPSFAFKDTVDPIALRNDFTRLGAAFNPNTRGAGAFSNAISTQRVSSSYALNGAGNAATPEGPAPGADANEDFFLYSIPKITLAKGERATFSLTNSSLKYADIYAFDNPAAPPAEVYRDLNYDQQRAISAQLAAPQVMHRIRLFNDTKAPLTTAPTLIESNGRLLAQTLMTYTATGGRSDIDLAPAVDVTVKRQETETKRTPNSLKFRDNDYTRVDVAGTLTVTSYRSEPITVEVSQKLVGTTDKVGFEGQTRKLGMGDDALNAEDNRPSWWNYNTGDWRAVNGLSAVKWVLQVPAKGKLEVPYAYHYFWR